MRLLERNNQATFVTLLLSVLVLGSGALWSALEWSGLPWVLGALAWLSTTAWLRSWGEYKYGVEDITELLEKQETE